jgi:hypothetical protein
MGKHHPTASMDTTPDHRALGDELPPGYIDPEHKDQDRELLEVFYRACCSEGGTADEIHLRGLKAVLALAQPEPEWPSVETMAQIVYENAMLATAPEHTRPHWPSWSDLPNSTARIHSLNTAKIILTRWGRPAVEPVPVSERPWERKKGWNDPDGECWWCPPDGPPYWQMANPAMVYGGWLLPAHAMPVPKAQP